MRRFALTLAAYFLSLLAVGQEVYVHPFTFNIPDSWYVEGGDGSTRLFAKSGKGYMEPPLIMVESCVFGENTDCYEYATNPSPYDPEKQKKAYRQLCGDNEYVEISRKDNLVEKRLICPNVGYSLYIADDAILSVAYASKTNDGISGFLDYIYSTLSHVKK